MLEMELNPTSPGHQKSETQLQGALKTGVSRDLRIVTEECFYKGEQYIH